LVFGFFGGFSFVSEQSREVIDNISPGHKRWASKYKKMNE